MFNIPLENSSCVKSPGYPRVADKTPNKTKGAAMFNIILRVLSLFSFLVIDQDKKFVVLFFDVSI